MPALHSEPPDYRLLVAPIIAQFRAGRKRFALSLQCVLAAD
jgi:hypothetical protein